MARAVPRGASRPGVALSYELDVVGISDDMSETVELLRVRHQSLIRLVRLPRIAASRSPPAEAPRTGHNRVLDASLA
jgi:hypothetical protein